MTDEIKRESHLYNEGALIVTLAHTRAMLLDPPGLWKDTLCACAQKNLPAMLDRLESALHSEKSEPLTFLGEQGLSAGAQAAILKSVRGLRSILQNIIK